MNKEGDTLSATPPTVTKMGFFKPGVPEGNIHYGDESWPVYGGVVECPLEVAVGGQWPWAVGEEVEAFKKAKAAAEKVAEAGAKAKAEADAKAKKSAEKAEADAKKAAEKAEADAKAQAEADAKKAAEPPANAK